MLVRFLRATLPPLFKFAFRLEIRGLEHFAPLAGQPAVIIANHQSFLDPLLLAAFLPGSPAFAMNTFQAKKWYFKPLLKLVDVFPVDPTNPMAAKTIINKLKEGHKVVIFPEGRITTTGGVMKIYDGTGMIVDKADVPVIPVRIDGAHYSYLGRMHGKLRLRLFPKIRITVLPPTALQLPKTLQGKERRRGAARRLYDIMTEAAFHTATTRTSLLDAIVGAAEGVSARHRIVTDPLQNHMTYRQMFTRTFVLAGLLRERIGIRRYVGVLLPTAPGGLLTFLALHMLGRVPAMLNFSAGSRNLKAACEMAELDTILTSRAFIVRGKLQPLIDALQPHANILYLEDIRKYATAYDKLRGLLRALYPRASLIHHQASPDDPAVLLYTSGSEGLPKGVALSHANILSNIHQAASRIAFTERDIMFNALPIFHSFGLSIGTLLPLVLGMRVYLYPSPLHYRMVPEAVYDSGATIMLGTDTFFNGYANYAHPYDFQSVRLAVAGAEKLKASTRQKYAEVYRINIMEGYGVTETSPAISFNTPVETKVGSVGRPFPCINTRIEEIEGLERGGKLLVSGPNVMLGYIKADQPGVIQPHREWYDTGDIVDIDAEGFITILGRAKRFAKVGGEMVSLAVIEEFASQLSPGRAHAAMAAPDERKGEQIVLFTEDEALTRERILAEAKTSGITELALPRKVQPIGEIPRLGSGKVDYMRLKELMASL